MKKCGNFFIRSKGHNFRYALLTTRIFLQCNIKRTNKYKLVKLKVLLKFCNEVFSTSVQ